MDGTEKIIRQVHAKGYAVIQQLAPKLTTEQVATALGSIMDVSTVLPGIPKIQTLRPREPGPELMSQYSGTYGTGGFPLHSDLAHWHLPPRYLILRCIVGARDVATTLVSYAAVTSAVGERTLVRALVAPRRKAKGQIISPLSVVFCHQGIWGIRWDFLFLRPLNEAAEETSRVLSTRCWTEDELVAVKLTEPGDTVVIDNWKMLHGRSAVPPSSMHREIHRTYLDKIGDS